MSDLKPCPFCGGTAEIVRMGSGRQSMQYGCTSCSCVLETGETFIGPNCSWNQRHAEADLAEAVRLLQECSAHVHKLAPYPCKEVSDFIAKHAPTTPSGPPGANPLSPPET